ncbi:hypothetical protein Tco_1484801 [Tanacetum coccineum]
MKGSGGGRGVKEKNKDVAAKDGVSPAVTDEPVVKEKQGTSVDTCIPNVENTDLRSYPPLPTQVSAPAGNTPGMSSYANVIGNTPGKKDSNFYTLYTPGGNGIDVLVPEESIRAISKRFANTAYGFFLGNSMDSLNSMLENGPWFIRSYPLILKMWNLDENLMKENIRNVPSWGMSSYSRAMIELWADEELKDTIVVAMPRITGEGIIHVLFMLNMNGNPLGVHVVRFFCHTQEECPKNLGVGVVKKFKKPSQTSRGVLVGPKVGFKPHKEYRLVPKKATANSSSNKKKGVEPTNEVSNSNPFDVLNTIDNDMELDTHGGTSNLGNKGANLSGSSFWNVKNSSTSTTPITDKIGKYENLIIDRQAILMDEVGNPLKKERVGFGTQSLLEQWRDSYGNGDYDDDLYDDDMYEGQDLTKELQTICDNLDIRVHGRKKKYFFLFLLSGHFVCLPFRK